MFKSEPTKLVAVGMLLLPMLIACAASQEEGSPTESAPAATAMLDGEDDLAHFVIQTHEERDPVNIERRVADRLGSPAAVVTRLFEEVDPVDDPEGMSRMFRLSLAREALSSSNAWDAAYSLEETLDLARVEPDFASLRAEVLESGALCFVDGAPPADKGWSVEAISAVEAWELTPPGGGRRFGEGVSICHPDTGWSQHVDLDAARLDLTRAKNLLVDGPRNARDPLDYSGGLLNPGHGTGTGSVIVSQHDRGEISGVAPLATLVPIRTAKSVVQVFDSDLARAVNHAVAADCDVISMSLGGRAYFGLRAAIERAVRNDVIVIAAAGNCVRFVVAPAAYPQCLAVAGTNVDGMPWTGSSRGRAVDVSAPGEHVWVARRRAASEPADGLVAGQGTSYAVANVAGAAALWLAYHDLIDAEPGSLGVPLQEVFRHLVRRTAVRPPGWDGRRYGDGILDVKALLEADPSLPEPIAEPVETTTGELELLAAVVDRTPQELGPLVAGLFDVPLAAIEDELRRWGPELIDLALSDPDHFDRLLGSLAGEEVGVPMVMPLPGASSRLRREIE